MSATRPSEFRRTVALTATLTAREIRSQYNRTVLGRVWSFISPLVTIAVFTVVFGLIFRGVAPAGINSGVQSFAMWIAVGVVSWTFIASSVSAGMSSLIGNAGLLEKVYFPRAVLVFSAVASATVTFLTELLVVIVVMAFVAGPMVFAWIPLVLVFVILTAVFCAGLGLLLAVAVIWFRDIEYLWGLFQQVWMYASGVVFPVTLVADASITLYNNGISWNGEPIPLLEIFRLNPAQQFLEAFRSLIYDYAMPEPHVWITCTLWSIGMLAVGLLVFRAKQARIVEEL